ncbi:MAG: hypothetical protein ACRDNP_03550 [Gaiellaceae bacterium]
MLDVFDALREAAFVRVLALLDSFREVTLLFVLGVLLYVLGSLCEAALVLVLLGNPASSVDAPSVPSAGTL